MDTGEYIPPVDNMDSTLAELGDEFTLGDFDGESVGCRWCLLVGFLNAGLFPETLLHITSMIFDV